jgi:hypothetical protein
MFGRMDLCVGCKREDPCHHDRDVCVSQHLFVFSMGLADDPMVIERIEGRTKEINDEVERLQGRIEACSR